MAETETASDPQRAAFTDLVAATIRHCETEITQMTSMVKQLEKNTRQKLLDRYGAQDAWQGLASDDFLIMVDRLRELGQDLNTPLAQAIKL